MPNQRIYSLTFFNKTDGVERNGNIKTYKKKETLLILSKSGQTHLAPLESENDRSTICHETEMCK